MITLAVPDLDAAHAYYVDRLGWEPALAIPGEVTFLRAGSGRMVVPFGWDDLAADIDSGAPPPFDLGHLCADEAGVDAVTRALVDPAAACASLLSGRRGAATTPTSRLPTAPCG